MDSASGSHCTDFTNFLKKHRLAASGIPCFERTADLKSSSLPKFVKNSTSNTANLRILESFGCSLTFLAFSKVDSSPKILESRSGKKNKHKLPNPTASGFKLESTFLSSLRALAQDKARQSTHSTHSKPAESKRHKLHTSTYSLHTFLESQAPLKSPTNLESTFDKTQMDCHAIATALARNDKNNTQSLSASQAAAKSSKTQTRILVQNDSKICGGAVVALRLLGKVSDLGDRAFHKTRDTARR